MDVRRDPLVEPPGPLAAEQEAVPTRGRAAHAQLLAPIRDALAVLPAEPGTADRGLAVVPALVGPVVAVPRRERPLVELRDQLVADGLAARGRVHRILQHGELAHGDRAEAD